MLNIFNVNVIPVAVFNKTWYVLKILDNRHYDTSTVNLYIFVKFSLQYLESFIQLHDKKKYTIKYTVKHTLHKFIF